VHRALLIGLLALAVGNLAMFSVTGLYPQIAFNLGNRAATLGTLILAYVFVVSPVPRAVRYGILALFLLASLGMSAHWKAWQAHQTAVIDRIRHNRDVRTYDGPLPIWVSGNQYSRLGPFSHIEFLSEDSVANSVFLLATEGRVSAYRLTKRLVVQNGTLWDGKYETGHPVGPNVTIYDSNTDRLYQVPSHRVTEEIARLPDEPRHWIQMIRNEYLVAWIVRLMPRLRYAF
jgi:hypothetical protein